VLVAEIPVNELGRDTVEIASDAFAIPAFEITNVSVMFEPTVTWFEEIVEATDRSTVETPVKLAVCVPLVMVTSIEDGVNTKLG